MYWVVLVPRVILQIICGGTLKELEAIKARVKEMEEEAEKLKEMQKQVEESIMSPTVGQSTCKIQLDFGFLPPSPLHQLS